MSIHRTTLGGGLLILLVVAAILLSGCQPEPDTINWTADDGAKHYGGA